MDKHAKDHYRPYSDKSPGGNYHTVICLHDSPDFPWKKLHQTVPQLPKGWFEVSQIDAESRIELIRDFWLSKMAFHVNLNEAIETFFRSLDDIEVYITQKSYDAPLVVEMVYSLANNEGFYHGFPGALDEEINSLKGQFLDHIFPTDYLAFLQIHNGFRKFTDTGVISTKEFMSNYQNLQKILGEEDPFSDKGAKGINPSSLIPFYKAFDMPCYQCFFDEWHPGEEMGNVYYSGLTKTISSTKHPDLCEEELAFTSFAEWLIFYLEKIG